MNYPSHYTSFLGGEVSPLFWHRCDMEKFSRWLATAENIRFHNVGAFYNRAGFERMGPTLNSLENPVVKLIPFIFNNNEVFEIEFTDGKFRVRKDGKVVVREDGTEVVYDSPIKIDSIQQLKYAQSGDIIFIASKTSPIYELKRMKEDGTEWALDKFGADILPLTEVNSDIDKVISLKATDSRKYYIAEAPLFSSGSFQTYFNVKVQLYGTNNFVRTPNNEAVSAEEVLDFFNEEFKDEVVFEKRGMFVKVKSENDHPFYSITGSTFSGLKESANDEKGLWESAGSYKRRILKDVAIPAVLLSKYPGLKKEYSLPDEIITSTYVESHWRENLAYIADAIEQDSGNKVFLRLVYSSGTEEKNHLDYGYYYRLSEFNGSDHIYYPTVMHYYDIESCGSRLDFVETSSETSYNASCSFDFFDSKTVGEVFAINVEKEASSIKYDWGTSSNSGVIKGDGKWRNITSGSWQGQIQLFFKVGDKDDWRLFRTVSSGNASYTKNDNSSGEIAADDIVSFYIKGEGFGSSSNAVYGLFEIPAFYANAYYKITEIIDSKNAVVSSVRNNIGDIENSHKWRESVFSHAHGYPESIGFYQNRLFLSKGYEIWGSKINDFWDFYEPIELSKDDPINISLLSYRVNDIKSILTARSFFVFTTGGEFGIASEGAISQDDKFLKQFSSHGINDCSPLLVGNIVIFVDSSGNTVRAFQYSFENDTYEANDMSVFIEEKLKGKQIITTEYMKNNKECLFLDSDGIVWVFKFFPEQNIMAWSHWKHSKYKITNLCVSPHGAYENLFIVVSTPNGKFIEKLNDTLYADSVHTFNSEESLTEVKTSFLEGDEVVVDDGGRKYKQTVGKEGMVALLNPAKSVSIGIPYISEATLLSPVISTKDVGYTTYNRKKPFKAHFCFSNSYGFKVGIKEEEKMSVDFHLPSDPIDNATTLTSGKKSVLIPSKYDGSAMVSFVQEEPYPMQIENIMLEVDYAGK